jgi:beta-glucosidase
VDDERVTDTVEKLVVEALAGLDLAARVRLLTGATFWRTRPVPEVGLEAMVLSDGPAGVRGERADEREPSASLPCPSALAATWDESLLRRVGRLVAAQARAKGVHVVLGPTVNLHRSPLGGRHFECLAEDPLLTARAGGALVRGIQDGGVAATVKHYVANESETDRFTVDARVDERALREVYLAPFESLVTEAGAWAVMAAYNSVAGVTMTENPLLRDPLKDLWGFDGVVVSDWFATRSAVPAALSGLDLVMPGPFGPWGPALVAAVESGEVPAELVEDKARRLLRLAARVGALADPAPDGSGVATPAPAGERPVDEGGDPAGPRARALLREAAAAGMVLLRNEGGLLPWDDLGSPGSRRSRAGVGAVPTGRRRIAVIGPNATLPRGQGGGSATVFPPHLVGPAAGLRAALGDDVEVVTATGVRAEPWPAPLTSDNARDPVSGEPGLRLRFLGERGRQLRSERRLAGRLLFMDDPVLTDCARIEATALVRARATGRHSFGMAGTGRFALTVTVDGVESALFDGVMEPPDGDLVAGFMRPSVWWDGLWLTEGQEALVTLRHDLLAGMPVASFGLLAEEPSPPPDVEFESAVALAAAADAVVVVVGTSDRAESEGVDRAGLALPEGQDDLVRRVAAVNPRTVVVVNAGAPVALPWRDEVAAVLLSWFPGQEFGAALADVLLGRAEPGGRLPTTWPDRAEDCPVLSVTPVDGALDYAEGIHVGYRGWARRTGPAPAYPLGHGLGYTTWSYEALDATAVVRAGESAQVNVTVRNTGARPGRTVVQAYLSRPASEVERPALWLAGFAAVDAAAGQAVTVPVRLTGRVFEHWRPAAPGADAGWLAEPGAFELRVGPSSASLPLGATLLVTVDD